MQSLENTFRFLFKKRKELIYDIIYFKSVLRLINFKFIKQQLPCFKSASVNESYRKQKTNFKNKRSGDESCG